ncbi:MAG: hypothetical protein FWE01_03235 [Firmicutes bacterium]|nr:hypothetical protein [Bacillota bacterium]
MRKFSLLILLAVACIGMMYGGASVIANASSRPSHPVIPPYVNYSYLSNPQLIATSNTHFFVLNQPDININEIELVILTRNNTQTRPPQVIYNSDTFLAGISDIKYSNNHLFLFTNDNYTVFDVSDMLAVSNWNQNLLANQLATFNPSLTPFFGFPPVFDLVSIPTPSGMPDARFSFRISYASRHQHSFHELTIRGTLATPIFVQTPDFTDHIPQSIDNRQIINGIAWNSQTGNTYLLASSPTSGGTSFFIYRSTPSSMPGTTPSEPLNTPYENFVVPSALTRSRDSGFQIIDLNPLRLVLISGRSIVLITPQPGTTPNIIHTISPVQNDDFNVGQNHTPRFITVGTSQELFVIDDHRKSIDLYHRNAGQLDFTAVAIGHRGSDGGFLNLPTSLSLIGENTFLVADHSNTMKHFGENPELSFNIQGGQNLSIIQSITWNNHRHIYIYDYHNNVHQIELLPNGGGRVIGQAITSFQDGNYTRSFTEINQLLTNYATNQIFAIESGHNRILRLDTISGTNTFNAMTINGYTITPRTRGTIIPTRTSDGIWRDKMLLINVRENGQPNFSHILFCLTHNEFFYDVTSNLNFGANLGLRDITHDAFGNPIVIATEYAPILAANEFLRDSVHLNHFTILINQGSTPSATLTQTFGNNGLKLENATANAGNVALNFNRVSGQLLWIGARHAIEAVELADEVDINNYPTVFSFENHRNNHHDWANTNTPLRPLDNPTATTPLFKQLAQSTLLYQFPGSVNFIRPLNTQSMVMILDATPVFGGNEFNYTRILFQERGNHEIGYINNRFLINHTYSTTTNVFGPNVQTDDMESGRVIISGAPIFKFPTTLRPELRIGTVNRHYNVERSLWQDHVTIPEHRAFGLRIVRLITVQDFLGMRFFQINVDELIGSRPNTQGPFAPNPTGTMVGFIYVGNVISYNAPESGFLRTNARIRLRGGSTQANVYQTPPPLPYIFDATHPEFLLNGKEVRINGRLDRSQEFTWISFRVMEGSHGITLHGFIRTEYILPDGLAWWHWLGIALAIVGALGIIIFTIRHIRGRKTQV